MSPIKIFQADAFTGELFRGNPAAVCLPDHWLSDDLMQSIAAENNLAETAFVVPAGKEFEIRWFTPTVEVDLCGHATLASAFVLFEVTGHPGAEIVFHSPRSGILRVTREDGMLFLDFPSDTLVKAADPAKDEIAKSIGIRPQEVFRGKTDFIAVVGSEREVNAIRPDMAAIGRLDARGLAVTARGDNVDFVSRFFAPQSGVPEDPVTGSAHTSLVPLWSDKLGKRTLSARQISKRGGELSCEFRGDRCRIGGKARLYLQGEILVE